LIVVDSSALVAIFLREPDRETLQQAIIDDGEAVISAATLLETSIVFRTFRGGRLPDEALDAFVTETLRVIDVDRSQVEIARAAHLRFGKGMGHPAQLNFGDCFSYALAKSLDIPLLYKGGDFAKTDIRSAL
jgi:ribonuclease VapC